MTLENICFGSFILSPSLLQSLVVGKKTSPHPYHPFKRGELYFVTSALFTIRAAKNPY